MVEVGVCEGFVEGVCVELVDLFNVGGCLFGRVMCAKGGGGVVVSLVGRRMGMTSCQPKAGTQSSLPASIDVAASGKLVLALHLQFVTVTVTVTRQR